MSSGNLILFAQILLIVAALIFLADGFGLARKFVKLSLIVFGLFFLTIAEFLRSCTTS